MTEPRYSVLHVIGARPHFMKLAPIYHTMREDPSFRQIIVHTGQHYDTALSAAFLEEFNLPQPDENLGVGSADPLIQIADMLRGLNECLKTYASDIVFVYGDTNSTAAGAIAAAKFNIPLAHVEAGLREFDKSIPEEINKLITDALSDIYFCPTQTARRLLAEAGITDNVYLTGDTVIDWISMHQEVIESHYSILADYGLDAGKYYFATVHRAANTGSRDNLENILSAFAELDMPVLLPLHPRTKLSIESNGLSEMLGSGDIRVVDPQGFWDTQVLIRNARCVLTDSGGITREAYYHRVPSLILDTQTEWVEIVQEGWSVVTGPRRDVIIERARTAQVADTEPGDLVRTGAALQICSHTKQYLNG